MRAEPPTHQSDRLEELGSYRILDSAEEQSFDEVAALAARICDTPVALISLVDRDRQWFKARYGFEERETPLESSVCSHAILSDDLLEIPDTLKDPRTVGNPLCIKTEKPMRFYAGASLTSRSGQKLGTLCVIDFKPRRLSDLQRDTLRVLAGQVMRQMELHRALYNESVLRDEIDHRVKNSLQTVMSFTRLYASNAKNDETREALSAIGRRVTAIAQLHSELYQTTDFDMIRLDIYLDRVAKLLKGSASANITLRTQIAQVRVDSRKAATLAMIISEFTANAIKHAFPEGREGQVLVHLDETEEGGLLLTCRDDGVGNTRPVPANTDGNVSIGTKLMQTAAEQIDGEMTLDAQPDGYVLRVSLPAPATSTASQAAAL